MCVLCWAELYSAITWSSGNEEMKMVRYSGFPISVTCGVSIIHIYQGQHPDGSSIQSMILRDLARMPP